MSGSMLFTFILFFFSVCTCTEDVEERREKLQNKGAQIAVPGPNPAPQPVKFWAGSMFWDLVTFKIHRNMHRNSVHLGSGHVFNSLWPFMACQEI